MQKTSIFLSHNKEDKTFVRQLAEDLGRAGIIAWLDEAEIKPGDSIIEKIEEGLHGSKYLAVILSPSSVNSSWVKRELRAVLHQQITINSKTVIPLLYKQCEIPLFLVDTLYIDFTDTENYSLALRLLLHRIDPAFNAPHVVTIEELQELIDKIPNPIRSRSLFQSRSNEEDIDFVTSNSIDISELESKIPWSRPKIYSAIRELIKTHRIELFLFKGITGGEHPDIPAGSKFVLPLIFKGLMAPHLRSTDEEIEKILTDLERQ